MTFKPIVDRLIVADYTVNLFIHTLSEAIQATFERERVQRGVGIAATSCALNTGRRSDHCISDGTRETRLALHVTGLVETSGRALNTVRGICIHASGF